LVDGRRVGPRLDAVITPVRRAVTDDTRTLIDPMPSGASRRPAPTAFPVIAGAAMALSSVSVVANALRLRRFRSDVR
jgi:hypothetical protein